MSSIQGIEHLVAQAMESDLPAGQILQQYFKAHAALGSKDRLRIADCFWQSLRAKPLPQWLVTSLTEALGERGFSAFAEAMTMPAPLDLRVNLGRARAQEILKSLHEEGISALALGLIDEALRVEGKPAIERCRSYQTGLVEIQDFGSQLLSRLASPKRGQTIVDFCAGAGGKTLAFAAALRGSGRVYAIDSSAARLARLRPRLERSGYQNIWPMAISGTRDARLEKIRSKADIVFVDAPCSGTGTLRRSPDLKWRLSEDRLAGLVSLQSEILAAASRLVRPGGRLVYATCSLLAIENQSVVDRFLLEHPSFCRVSSESVLAAQGILLPDSWGAWSADGDLNLWPHRSQTDGFFGAVLRRGASDQASGVG